MTGFRRVALAFFCLLPLSAQAQQDAAPEGGWPLEMVEAAPGEIPAGMPIGPVTIEINKLYDPRVRKESGRFGRAADALHFRTREPVVRAELLFAEGEPFSAARIAQTERNLRGLGLFIRVRIFVLPPRGGRVPIHVRVQDAWSLQFGANFKREGGSNSHSYGFEDKNFLGLGVGVSIDRRVGFQSTEESYGLTDHRIFGTADTLAATYAKLSDGRERTVSIERPFFAIDDHFAHLLFLQEKSSHLRLYENGDISHEYETRQVNGTIGAEWLALRPAPGKALRLGLGWLYSDVRFSLFAPPRPGDAHNLPVSALAEGPFVKIGWAHDDYRRRNGVIHPGRDMDFNLGMNVSGRFVFSSPAFGGTDARGVADAAVSWGVEDGKGRLAMFSGNWFGTLGLGRASHQFFTAAVRGWQPRREGGGLAGLAEVRTTNSPDASDYYYLGGSPGLRGYRENQFTGPHSALMVGEFRHYFKWSPLNLVQTGVVGFAEAGAIWGGPLNFSSRTAHYDAGLGLRLALLKISGNSLIKVDFGAPVGPRPSGSKALQITVGFRGDF